MSRNQDNLLDIAARSGYDVHWIDNGNGCKGVCARVDNRDVHLSNLVDICPGGECFDEIIVHRLDQHLLTINADTLIVLHQLESHGPAYFRRYPEAYRFFRPDCRSANFGECNLDEITNAYDNTIAYTDHVIATTIDVLKKHSDKINTSLIYISDHGESLGEHDLFLHGMPYAFAPDEKTTIPMIAWLSDEIRNSQLIQPDCEFSSESGSLSYDNLFHSELGLLGILCQKFLRMSGPPFGGAYDDTSLRFERNAPGESGNRRADEAMSNFTCGRSEWVVSLCDAL